MGETLFAAIVFIDDPGAGRRDAAFTLVFAGELVAFVLAGVMVEPKTAAFHEGYIGKHIVFCDLYKAVLQILGMGELPAVDQTDFFQKGAAGKTVKIGTGN